MSVTPNPNDGEPTVVMPAQAVGNASLSEITGWREASKRARRRRVALYAAVGTVLIAGMGSGWLFFARTERRLNASGPTSREVARPEVMQPASLPAPPPSPRAPDKPVGPRQMLNEIFEGRDRGLSVTAAVDRGAVRIGASRPGYVYVLAASANQSDGAALFARDLQPLEQLAGGRRVVYLLADERQQVLAVQHRAIVLFPTPADRTTLTNVHQQYYLSPPLTPFPHFPSYNDNPEHTSPALPSYHPSLPALQEMLPHENSQANSATDEERFRLHSALQEHPERGRKEIMEHHSLPWPKPVLPIPAVSHLMAAASVMAASVLMLALRALDTSQRVHLAARVRRLRDTHQLRQAILPPLQAWLSRVLASMAHRHLVRPTTRRRQCILQRLRHSADPQPS